MVFCMFLYNKYSTVGYPTAPKVRGAVSFRNVTFAYPRRALPIHEPIMTDLSLEIAGGSCVALMGASGSGKSAHILKKLTQPT